MQGKTLSEQNYFNIQRIVSLINFKKIFSFQGAFIAPSNFTARQKIIQTNFVQYSKHY